MTVPVWVWAVAAAGLAAAIGAEAALGRGSFTTRAAIGWIGVYVSLAGLFGLALGVTAGWLTAGQFYTGYLTEYSLSLDNGSGVSWAAEIPAWLSVLVVAAVLVATALAGTIAGRRPSGTRARITPQRRLSVIETDGNGLRPWDDGQLLVRRLCETFGHAADSAAGYAEDAAHRALFDTMLSHRDAHGDRPGFDATVGAAARSLIQVADADTNGVLDAGEYTRLAAVYGVGADEAERAFSRLDQDRNGVLDAAELTMAICHFLASRSLRVLAQ
jgi:hypothetical protein